MKRSGGGVSKLASWDGVSWSQARFLYNCDCLCLVHDSGNGLRMRMEEKRDRLC